MRQESIFEDNAVLIEQGPARQAEGLAEVAALGADTVRVLIEERSVAAAGFGPYDELVQGAQAVGLNVLLTPVGDRSRPSPRAYGRFVGELGERYPQVKRWSLWNEPNQPVWLSPQYVRRGKRKVNLAAALYRRLAASAVRALRATGHGSDVILLGETAPVGGQAGQARFGPTAPVAFLRELLCLRRGLPGCRGVKRLRVTGFSHHPYTQGARAAPGTKLSPGQISFDSVRRLKRLLRAGARRGVIPGRLPIWYTEFGYQTNPPDSLLGVSYSHQARYLNHADFIAARDPRIRSVAQYKLVDDEDRSGFQTGLRRYGTLDRKPAYGAYRLPLWVERRGSSLLVYGQVRPAEPGERVVVAIERDGVLVRPVVVESATGQFLERLAFVRGSYRLSAARPDGSLLRSRVAAVR